MGFEVLEDGRLTDGQGRTVDFRNTVIVMTSNLGSDVIQSLGLESASYEQVKSSVMESVSAHFRPEFINRIDEVVVFHSLGAEEIQRIATIQLKNLNKRLGEQGIVLNFDSDAMIKLAEAGFDPIYGARPLKRAIQRWVENPLAQKILAGEFSSGSKIRAKLNGSAIEFIAE